MIIVLLEPASRPGDLVHFRARLGRGLGYWCGPGAQPPGAEVDVEIDVVNDVDWSDIEEMQNSRPAMSIRGEGVEIQAPVADLNDDGVLSLDLGEGEIRLDTTGRQPTALPGCVRVALPPVEIYPTGI